MICPPQPLSEQHITDDFYCGHASLNQWLKKRAPKAARIGHSARTFVVCDQDQRVLAYYALASGSVNREDVPNKVARNTPDPVPVVLLARLAVDQSMAGRGMGRGLLKDAFLRVYSAAEQIGIRAILVHAIDEQARSFYVKHGFYDSPTHELTLMLTISEIEKEWISSP
ncbi:Acetyltransferase (GNAT) domain-containing protein [Ectothiorhodosinus mongolicus]|uniref:Acetyltransferase (GNAT) domain-containing protein n=1 Tax=Ectothiorhodosinus mongolicus TaxID=233100 RepID=A0A1R3W5E9_9GAMM|nr:GNAT family N-acetyltransferase [Ectothiorhodosinus mongolicus]ULX57612.1 GNAT family N-acetyltransferase [Ectothiorhodosinus mongolicus]SIT73099.1 Acetyltransferase (GNAT) domain-containing protein [Ectothiorhodosinus mongolicus]